MTILLLQARSRNTAKLTSFMLPKLEISYLCKKWLIILIHCNCFMANLQFDVPKHSNVGTSRADIPTGFVNPVHEASFDETDLDQRSIVSEATSGVASAMVDSGDDDDDDDTYFTDSKA